jgi:hypothetical protein
MDQRKLLMDTLVIGPRHPPLYPFPHFLGSNHSPPNLSLNFSACCRSANQNTRRTYLYRVIAVFKCPNVGFQVQARFPDLPDVDHTTGYQSLKCIACDGVHIVNTKTGQLFGDEPAED